MIKKPIGFKKFCRNLFYQENILGAGMGYKFVRGNMTGHNSVTVLVKEKKEANRLLKEEKVPEKFEGYNTDVLEVGDVKILELASNVLTLDRKKRWRPAPPGVSIGHKNVSAGTLGALVRDKKTGDLLILSNNHVLANSTNGADSLAYLGDAILQPALHDGGTEKEPFASLERFIPLHKEEYVPRCPKVAGLERVGNYFCKRFRTNYQLKFLKMQGKANLVDAALAKPINKYTVMSEIVEIGSIKGVKDAEIAMAVKKSGRTSGLTRSTVIVLGATMKVGVDSGSFVMMEDQIITGPMAKPGDSGSLVLDSKNNAIGLLMGGSEKVSIVCDIKHVLNELEVELVLSKDT